MSEQTPPVPAPGTIGWADLTVPDATALRDFYQAVAGWTPMALGMGGYEDFVMQAPDGSAVAGVCHARGANAALPPVWLVYITVPDLDVATRRCVELGGQLLAERRSAGAGSYCVIRDPAGAVAALYQPAAT
jgi:predicted enzyme related to lactoylglutathione lyase